MVGHGERQGVFEFLTRPQGELKQKRGGGAGTSAWSL